MLNSWVVFKKLFGIFLVCFGRAYFCSMPYERQFCKKGIKLYLDVGVGYFNMLFIKGKESKTNNKELALQSKGWMSILPIWNFYELIWNFLDHNFLSIVMFLLTFIVKVWVMGTGMDT